mmetsp:Transcript_33417/g.41265  ORF Transcript_33417/g.41265 Transcript_33417/m.41265 type:complete len:133 (+) Transcript_33417:348-746(+)
MGVLGQEISDFFFGCPIRGIQSKPVETRKPTSQRDEDKFEESKLSANENPLKTIKVWLDIATGLVEEGDNLRQATKAIRVDVRIFKAGGSSRQFQTNNLRKCARCARYSPAEDFSELKVDDLLPVTIEIDKD